MICSSNPLHFKNIPASFRSPFSHPLGSTFITFPHTTIFVSLFSIFCWLQKGFTVGCCWGYFFTAHSFIMYLLGFIKKRHKKESESEKMRSFFSHSMCMNRSSVTKVGQNTPMNCLLFFSDSNPLPFSFTFYYVWYVRLADVFVFIRFHLINNFPYCCICPPKLQ